MNCAGCHAPLTHRNKSGRCRSCSGRDTRDRMDRVALPWCPDDMRAEYHRIRKKGFSAEEAQRIILEHVAQRGVAA